MVASCFAWHKAPCLVVSSCDARPGRIHSHVSSLACQHSPVRQRQASQGHAARAHFCASAQARAQSTAGARRPASASSTTSGTARRTASRQSRSSASARPRAATAGSRSCGDARARLVANHWTIGGPPLETCGTLRYLGPHLCAFTVRMPRGGRAWVPPAQRAAARAV